MNTRTALLVLLLLPVAAGVSGAGPAAPASKAAAQQARFDKYDLDKNGVIDREEFKRLDADWHKAVARKTQVDTDADPVVDKGIRGETGIRGQD